MRGTWIAALLMAAACAIGVVGYALAPTATMPIKAPAEPESARVDAGRYLALAGDCSACHSAPGATAFAGGVGIATPLGTIYSSNITPDRASGIGAYSLDDFDRALRRGIARDGHTLYPAMPYPSYARLADEDVRALYSYFMLAVQPVAAADRAPAIPWPLSMRWPLAIWRKLFAPGSASFDGARYGDARVARGAYLVQGLGHCGSCHTPRAPSLQEKALDDSGEDYLAGGAVIDGWSAINLRGDLADGLGAWSAADIVATLRSARSASAAVVAEPMDDVVVHSTQYLSEADLGAIAAYLKTLPASARDRSAFAADPATARALQAGLADSRGAELYLDNCAACHGSDGAGHPRAFPRIAGNALVLAHDPTSLVRLILGGSRLPATRSAPSELGMPGFAWRLADDEVAQLANFVRTSWGNRAAALAASDVRRVRTDLQQRGTSGPHG